MFSQRDVKKIANWDISRIVETYMESSIIEMGLEQLATCRFLNSALKQMSKQAKQRLKANNTNTTYENSAKAIPSLPVNILYYRSHN